MEGAEGDVLWGHGERSGPLLLSKGIARVAAALAAAAVAACGSSSSAGVVGADGVATPNIDASRIVSLSGAVTEIVYELGFGDSVVAVDVTTVAPPPATELPIVGVGRFLAAEAVLEQRPTLVIADTQTSPLEALEQIRGAGVSVLVTQVPTSFDELYTTFELIGDALGAADAAEAAVLRLKAQIDNAVSTVDQSDPPIVAFVYSRGPDVILLFGAEMTTQPLIEAAGGIDAGTAAGIVGTVDFTPEALVAAQPDVIVITSEGLDLLGGVDELLELPGFAATPAGQARRILSYPEGDVLTFGPRIGDVLEQLISDLSS